MTMTPGSDCGVRFSRRDTSKRWETELDAPTPEQLEWVCRAQRGDAAAFGRLIPRYERVALGIAFAITGDPAQAGDVVQEAFVRAWERLADLKDPRKFGPWLCGIVRNMAVNSFRRERAGLRVRSRAANPDGEAHYGGGPLAPDPAEELSRRETADRLAAALAALDETARTVVVLRYYDNLTSREIGQLLGLAPTAVDMRLTRARRQLRELLGDALCSPTET